MHVTVWGAGAWGVALAGDIVRTGHEVQVYSRRRASARLGPSFAALPATVAVTDDLPRAAASSEMWLVVTPTPYLEDLALRLSPHVRPETVVLCSVKGLSAGSGERPTEVLGRLWAHASAAPLATLGGPTLAHEMGRDAPASAVLAGSEPGLDPWRRALGGGSLRLEASDDVVGVELAGALKNVVVIVSACARALYGENVAAALAHAGFDEMRRLARAAGARDETILGIAGLGDLLLTHAAADSRNRRCGEAIAAGRPLEAWLRAQESVVEGVGSAFGAHRLATRLGVSTPVFASALALVRGKPPRDTLALLLRALGQGGGGPLERPRQPFAALLPSRPAAAPSGPPPLA